MRTSPLVSKRSAAAGDPTSGRLARYRSSRSPAAASGTRCFTHPPRLRRLAVGRDEREEEDRDADDDEAVGEVERGPELEVQEVRHVSEPHAVDEVRETAADHETEGDRQHRVPRSRAGEEVEHPR